MSLISVFEGLAMSREQEIQAVLDVLFISKTLNWEFEQRMWHQAKSYDSAPTLAKMGFKRPERMYPGWSKQEFDRTFRNLVSLALDQVERVRKGAKAMEIAPVVANVVEIQRDQWAVEIYVSSRVDFIEGFDSHGAAESWVRNGMKQYLIEKDLQARGQPILVGQSYG